MTLPFDGELFPAKQKSSEVRIVFVPNFGSSKSKIKRYIRFVNELGFDAVAFNLTHNEWPLPLLKMPWHIPIDQEKRFGVRYLWNDEVGQVLDAVEGEKIVFSLSLPSIAALGAISQRKAKDVKAWVCEGGPFFDELQCAWNLLTHGFHVKNPLLRTGMVAFLTLLFGAPHRFHKEVHQQLESLPHNFPVLSIRAWKDQLVPYQSIDKVFAPHRHIDLQVLALAEAGHLNGLSRYSEEYLPAVSSFLKSHV